MIWFNTWLFCQKLLKLAIDLNRINYFKYSLSDWITNESRIIDLWSKKKNVTDDNLWYLINPN